MKIEVENITKSFGENSVLKGVSIEAESGKAVGILGRNGAGKTTTIRIIMGVFAPDSGEVLADGEKINRDRIRIGYLPEERGMYPKKIIIDQLVYFAVLKGMSKAEAKASAEYWLEKLQMSEHKNRRLDNLSKGNQQKIQLAATLISNPDIIILDEPFSGLDPVNAMLLENIVREFIGSGKIALFSSHQMNYIEEFCDDIYILNGGRIVLNGSIKKIKHSYDRSRIIISSVELERVKNFVVNDLSRITEDCYVENDRLTVKLNASEDKGILLEGLARGHFDIDEIKVFEPSLNDIFVEYTEAKI